MTNSQRCMFQHPATHSTRHCLSLSPLLLLRIRRRPLLLLLRELLLCLLLRCLWAQQYVKGSGQGFAAGGAVRVD